MTKILTGALQALDPSITILKEFPTWGGVAFTFNPESWFRQYLQLGVTQTIAGALDYDGCGRYLDPHASPHHGAFPYTIGLAFWNLSGSISFHFQLVTKRCPLQDPSTLRLPHAITKTSIKAWALWATTNAEPEPRGVGRPVIFTQFAVLAANYAAAHHCESLGIVVPSCLFHSISKPGGVEIHFEDLPYQNGFLKVANWGATSPE